mgnify:CR=1
EAAEGARSQRRTTSSDTARRAVSADQTLPSHIGWVEVMLKNLNHVVSLVPVFFAYSSTSTVSSTQCLLLNIS